MGLISFASNVLKQREDGDFPTEILAIEKKSLDQSIVFYVINSCCGSVRPTKDVLKISFNGVMKTAEQ